MSDDSFKNTGFSDPELRAAVAVAMAGVAPTAMTLDIEAPKHWPLAREMGWLTAYLPEAQGGLGLGLAFIADLGEQVGRHLFSGPLLETALFLPVLSETLPKADALAPLLEQIAQGQLRLGFSEDFGQPETGFVTEHLGSATHMLQLLSGSRESALRVYAVDQAQVAMVQPMDPTASVGRLRPAAPLFEVRLPNAQLAPLHLALHIATAADLLGAGEEALVRALEHVKTRRQFGQPIGGFQVVKHRLADVRSALDVARLALARAVQAPQLQAVDSGRMARVLAAEAALAATAAAVQLHGGLGFSWEMDLHLWLKRVRRLNARSGGTAALRHATGERIIRAALEVSGI
ncbi:acyl-CoA dehydrogenase family protein [Pararhodobacter oceanensis]|uniref:acyl-CoA dehydrogenase family protein n=1 Tax=Pararhodobacter oceanensis TaxID=2172121 RepID=UPI003A8DFB33